MGKTKIKNISRYNVNIFLPNVHFSRELRPGQETTVTEDVFEDFSFDEGCRNFIRHGFLQVITEDEAVSERVVTAEQTTAAEIDIDDLLLHQPIANLSQVLKNASIAFLDSIAARAIELSIADEAHCNIIKKYTGVDVIKAINLNHEK